MKVTFAIFFCVILGFTTAKHLFDEESKGFQTTEDLSLARQGDTQYDDPEQMKKKTIFNLTEALLNLAKCLNDGTKTKHECFQKFKKRIKLPAVTKCVNQFDKCEKGGPGVFFQCSKKFKDCVHANTALV